MDARPIGVFDSGVGGLTVFKALKRRLPSESLIYFGDTAHVPYGSKSREAVSHYAGSVARFLVGKDIKLLVVACNTASALALDALKGELTIPVVGVIEPGIRAAAGGGSKVGVIATEATIASGAYQTRLKESLTSSRVYPAACPLFVPLVEEGWWSHAVTRSIASEYLRPLKRAGIDSLILGCTHYPLLKPVFKKILGKKVMLIDSADEIAADVETALKAHDIMAERGPASYVFYASDGPERFLRLAKRLLGVAIENVQIHRFD